MSHAEILEIQGSISNIRIGNAQRELETTPSDPFPLPQTTGAYTVDSSVITGKFTHCSALAA